nr:glycosyltransferase family 2 protein [Tessaracoccus sp. MC1679]
MERKRPARREPLVTTLSALIPHYGDPEPTLTLIEQLRGQEGLSGLEIIVSDDLSPVPFPEGPGYQLVRRSENGGFSSNVNSAAAVATGDYIVILNSDLSLGPDTLADLLAAARPHQPAVCSPKVLEAGQPIHTARKWPRVRHHAWEWLTPLARFRQTRLWHRFVGHDVAAFEAQDGTPTDWVMGACMLLPREAFERAGGMDERFYMNSEEVDLQRRLTTLGVPSVYLPQVGVEHVGGGSSPSAKRRGWVTDSRFQYAHKWGGADRLRLALRVATQLNYLWNLTRQLRRVPDVDARAARRDELGIIEHAWSSRAGYAWKRSR